MGINEFIEKNRRAVLMGLIGAFGSFGLWAAMNLAELNDYKSLAGLKTAEACEEVRLPKKRAVIVCQDSVALDDALTIRHLLVKKRYIPECIGIGDATEQKIFSALERIASDSVDYDKTIFYFAGHGDSYYDGILQGICVNKPSEEGEKLIRPAYLLDRLSKIKGRKAAIFNCCYSGVHVELVRDDGKGNNETIFPDLKNYLIIAACPSDKLMVYTPDCIPGKRVSPLTAALFGVLKGDKQVNLSSEPITLGTEWQRAHQQEYAERIGVKENKLSFEVQRVSDCDFKL